MIELGLVNIGEHNNAMFMDGNSAALHSRRLAVVSGIQWRLIMDSIRIDFYRSVRSLDLMER